MKTNKNVIYRPLRLTIICHNTPYPPNHGGKLDMWNSALMLREEDIELQILSWHDTDLNEEHTKKINSVASNHYVMKLSRKPLFRITHLPLLLFYPWFSCIRWPMDGSLKEVTKSVSQFSPDALLLHGWHGALLAFFLNKKLGIPILYRAHNVEYLYIKNQLKYTSGIKNKTINLISQLHMRRFEKKILSRSEKIYAISDNDATIFRSQGYDNVRTIFPFMKIKKFEHQQKKPFDLLFLGNLHTKNNVSGLKWLIEEVMPIVFHIRDDITLAVAGSEPTTDFLAYLKSKKNIKILIDQESSESTLSMGKIYVNPVESAGGIQLKNIEMAAFGRPIVARTKSVLGLPDEILDLFELADTPHDFANAIVRNLSAANPHRDNLDKLSNYFGEKQPREIIKDLEKIVTKNLLARKQSLY